MFEGKSAKYSGYTVQRPFAWVKRGVLGVAVVGFVGLIWYAASHRSGLETENVEPPLVHAPQFAVKQRAVEPGGMEVPHQDKQVFDLLADDNAAAAPTAQDIEQNVAAAKEQAAAPAAPVAPVAAPQAPAAPAAAQPVAQPQAAAAAPAVAPAPAATPVAAPAAPKPSATPSTAAAAKPAPTGWGVQLGSFRSNADAERGISVFQKKYAGILEGLTPYVKQVQLSRGTYYRVIFVGLESKEASVNLCQAFKQKGQGCLNVKL